MKIQNPVRNRMGSRGAVLASSLLAMLLLVATRGQAVSVQVVINGQITSSPTPAVAVGTPFAATLTLDSATADEVAAAGAFLATNPGTVASSLLVPVSGPINSITTTGSTQWIADSTLVALGNALPTVMTLIGTGMTPDQILPDFTTLSAGTISVDLNSLGAFGISGTAFASVTSIGSLPVMFGPLVVPEPTELLLLGLAAALLAGRRVRTGPMG